MKKKLLVLGAAAMVVAAAVPALAFENEFHGIYRLRADVTNFQEAGLAGIQGQTSAAAVPAVPSSGGPVPTPIVPGSAAVPAKYFTKSGALLAKDDRTFTTFEQRARIQYIAKASDDLKLVTHFEIDSSWGDGAYFNGRGVGGGAGADSVNLETKNVYLDFNIPSIPVNMKTGIQPWSDAYKGIIYNNDLGGALATGKFDAFTAQAAFFRTYDGGGATTLGKKNVDLYVLDGKFAVNKDTTIGASYYLIDNDNTKNWTTAPAAGKFGTVGTENALLHTFGLNAATKLGIVNVDAFALYQTGDAIYDFQAANGKTKDVSAWAAQVAASANLGMATVRGAFLYTSGDDKKKADKSDAFQVIQENNVQGPAAPTFSLAGGNYYSANMLLLFRNVVNMDSDQALVANLNNGNHGVMAGFLGTDIKVNDKFTIVANLGAAWNAEKNKSAAAATAVGNEKEDYIGTEVNLNLNYKLYPNLTATLQGAYVMLGKFYDNTIADAGVKTSKDPADPYLAGLMLNYTF
jgi:hypothetical protein